MYVVEVERCQLVAQHDRDGSPVETIPIGVPGVERQSRDTKVATGFEQRGKAPIPRYLIVTAVVRGYRNVRLDSESELRVLPEDLPSARRTLCRQMSALASALDDRTNGTTRSIEPVRGDRDHSDEVERPPAAFVGESVKLHGVHLGGRTRDRRIMRRFPACRPARHLVSSSRSTSCRLTGPLFDNAYGYIRENY